MLSKNEHELLELLKNKLSDHELPVSDHLWSNIQTKIPNGSSSTGILSGMKTLLAAGVFAAFVASVWFIWKNNSNESATSVPEQSNQAPANGLLADSSLSENFENTEQQSHSPNKNQENNKPNKHSVVATPKNDFQISPSMDEPKKPSIQVRVDNIENVPEDKDDAQPDNTSVLSAPKENPFNARFSAIQQDREKLVYFLFPEYTGNCTVNWDLGDGNFSSEKAISHEFEREGIYTVRLAITNPETKQELIQEQSIEAWLPVQFHLPNIFTPNGDGNNDALDVPSCSSGCTILNLLIADATGREIFKSSDGIWRGFDDAANPAAEGTYIYTISFRDRSGKNDVRQGLITLKR